MLATFSTKQIDAFAAPPPWPLVPAMDGSGVLLASAPNGDRPDLDRFANGLIVARAKTCRPRPAFCAAMGHSFVEAEAYLHKHSRESLALLKHRFYEN